MLDCGNAHGVSTETHLVDEWEPHFLLLPRRVATVWQKDQVLERRWQWLRHCGRRQNVVLTSAGDHVRVWYEYTCIPRTAMLRLKQGASGREFNELMRKR